MPDRIVCTRCGVISRGFVGNCLHVENVIAAEREACAVVTESLCCAGENSMPCGNTGVCKWCDAAKRIRARE